MHISIIDNRMILIFYQTSKTKWHVQERGEGVRAIFVTSFWTGVIMTVVSFVLGRIFDFLNIDGDIDIQGHMSFMTISPLKPIVILTFITVFGGTGIMSMERWGSIISLFIALAAAFLVSFAVYRFIVVPLYRAQNTSAVSQKELIGHEANAALEMEGESFGKIIYIVNGNTYTSPAKSIDGARINRGERVVIEKIENNVFWVRSQIDKKERSEANEFF